MAQQDWWPLSAAQRNRLLPRAAALGSTSEAQQQMQHHPGQQLLPLQLLLALQMVPCSSHTAFHRLLA